jgi:hypothetical protein
MTRLYSYQRLILVLTVLALILPITPARSARAAPPGAQAVAPAMPTANITLTPAADAFLDSGRSITNFGQTDTLDVATLFDTIDSVTTLRTALIRFDLGILPAGSIIDRAELRLRQIGASGNDWTINLNRVTTAWEENTVTWNSRPFRTAFTTGLPTPNPGDDPAIAWDVTELVRAWAYGGAVNLGLELAGSEEFNFTRSFSSREGATPPQLYIEYTPPPTNLVIAEDTTPVNLDGQCQPADEYAAATALPYVDVGGTLATVYLKHDAEAIYICFAAPPGTVVNRFFGVYLDTDFGREKYATEDDVGLHIQPLTGITATVQGTGDSTQVYTPTVIAGWQAVASVNDGQADTAEYVIQRSLFNRTCTSPFGLALYHRQVRDQGNDYGLPTPPAFDFPERWIEATLENPGCIRVCSEVALPCTAAPGATVFDADSGVAYMLDDDGYVRDASLITEGERLWARLPVSTTGTATLYHTSGDPQTVTPEAFRAPVPGTMSLVVSGQRPLWVQDLTVAAQWYVEGDAARATWLRVNLIKASDYLYHFTDGQFALGKVTVGQGYDGWADADLQLHLNNVFQPRAVIGGIVPTATVDLDASVPVTYTPGAIYMGSHWNRYGAPPDQPVFEDGAPVLPSTMTNDWAIALAHELGHYLLFLFDVYTDIDGNASEELAEQCTLSAMGDAYRPSNHAFIYDQAHWEANCNQTEAYNTLPGRTEWETIRLWYPWTITPTSFVTGPVLPAGVTTVTFLAPSVMPSSPAASQIFDLLYVDNELASGEARVFLLRENRVLEQGKPAEGSNQVHLIDVRLGDRLCVYDVDDHADADATPRHQFGCEIVQPADAVLQMTKNQSWAPEVAVRQTGPNQVSLVVTQTVDGPLHAALFPEHGQQLAELTLVDAGDVYSGTFNLPQTVPPLYLRLFVSETVSAPTSQREVIVDRGTGGSGAFGPAQRGGKVLVISSDSNATFESNAPLDLQAGESIAWQSMPGTPPLPPNLEILGQSYRLDAFPATLVENGKVSIRFDEPAPTLQAAGVNQVGAGTPELYFWDGNTWQALDTTITTPVNAADGEKLAAAQSQGVGVYAVLMNQGQTRLLLPLIAR